MRELPPKLIDTGSDLRFCPVCNRKYTMTQSEKQVVRHPSTHRLSDMTPILCCERHEHRVKVAAYRLNSNLLCIDREMLGHGAEALQSSIDEIDARLERVRRDDAR